MNNNILTSKPREPDITAQFWAWHPIGRAIAIGLLTEIFTKTPFVTGLVYGGISGLTNLSLRVLQKKADIQFNNPETKAVNHLFCATFPWLLSSFIMKQAYKETGKSLFYLSPRAAIGAAFVAELFGYANRDLLIDKDTLHYQMDFFSKE